MQLHLVPPDGSEPVGAQPPVCPDDVTDDVRAVWDYTAEHMAATGRLTPGCRDALRAYCEAVITHRKASALLARSPVLVPGAFKNTVVPNPAARVQRDAARTIHTYAQELGLTTALTGPRDAHGNPAGLPHLYEQ
jgi:P27 family predicted phage terminase small subunit